MSLLFEVKNLSVRRGGVHILRSVNWSVRKGEHWVILGANGSGKTSLLKAITGYMTPTDGEIYLLNEHFGDSDWRELRQHVGVVSASISHLVHDEDNGLEIVAGGKKAMIGYWGRITKEEAQQAKRLLRLLRVPYAADRSWEVLSQGERQRVLIARALMPEPKLLILDEPCAGLDPVARERFLQDLSRLASRKNAPGLVLVTHHIEEILPEFSHLLAIRNGRVTYSGSKVDGLSSKLLGHVFGAKISVRRNGERYQVQKISRN